MKITLVDILRIIAIIAFAVTIILRSKNHLLAAMWVTLGIGIIFLIAFIGVKTDKSYKKRAAKK